MSEKPSVQKNVINREITYTNTLSGAQTAIHPITSVINVINSDGKTLEQILQAITPGGGGVPPADISDLQDKFRLVRNRINVIECGADPTGVIDSTDAIQNAIDQCVEGRFSVVYFPTGRYKTTRPLILPLPVRPNTDGTQGFGIKFVGDGMYDSGIIYTGTEYAIYSDKNMAEAFVFEDFYINHARGGGVRVPQGCHQLFERFSSSACAEGYYGVLIEGNRSATDPVGGYGSYMVMFDRCRFWSERGYLGTGVRIEQSVLCTLLQNCFFSRSVTNRPHLEVFQSDTVVLNNCAFERSEQTVPGVDPSIGRTEEMVKAEAREANGRMTAPLILLDGCHAVTIEGCHAEWVFDSFVDIKGHTSGVTIDACRISHYANTDFNPNKGYILRVDPTSTSSRDIVIGRRNYRTQTNHENATKGQSFLDPIGCVTVESDYDGTPYQDANYLAERRSIPYLGSTGHNILHNPALVAASLNATPMFMEMVEGQWTFTQLSNISGCNIKQTGPHGTKYRFRLRTTEHMNKHDFYTFIVVGRNKSGSSFPLFIDIGGDANDLTCIFPSGNQIFTQAHRFSGRDTNIIDFVLYTLVDFDIFGFYVIPGIVNQVPYGQEVLSASTLHSPVVKTGLVKFYPTSQIPTPSEAYRGSIITVQETDKDDRALICKKKSDGTYVWDEAPSIHDQPEEKPVDMGRLWTDFSKWGLWYGVGEQVTDINKTGASSMRIRTNTGPDTTSAARLRNTRLNLAKTKSLMLRFYAGDMATLSKLEVRFSSQDNMAGYLSWSLSRWKMSKGWNEVMIPIKSLNVSGTESINNLMTTIQVSVTGTGGYVVFDSMYINRPTRPTVIFRFDDGWLTQYTKAYPILNSVGFVGCIGAISNYVGTSGYATKSQLKELQSYGWEIFNHTANHRDLTTIPASEIRAEIDSCRDWLHAEGFDKAASIVAYPYGSFNDDVIAAMGTYDLGLSTQEELELAPPISPLMVKTLGITNSTADSVYENAVNLAVETGSTLIILLHRIEDTGTDSMIYHTDKFIKMVNFIADKDIDVVTFNEWLEK